MDDKNIIKFTEKNIIIAIILGCVYMGVEIIWRGHSSISMGIVGGISGIIIGLLNEYFPWSLSFWLQCGIGMIVITFFEGVSGLILNVWLKLNIWDYSSLPGTFFFGQCCIPYCIAWFFLAGVAIFLDDWLRAKLFNEPFKGYNFKLTSAY